MERGYVNQLETVFHTICEYLDLRDIAVLCMTCTTLWDKALVDKIERRSLYIYEEQEYIIDRNIASYLFSLNALTGLEPCVKSARGSKGDICNLTSTTAYSTYAGGFEQRSPADELRLRLTKRGSSTKFVGSEWMMMTVSAQTSWITKLKMIQFLRVDVDGTGSKGIRPEILALMLTLYKETLLSVQLYWMPCCRGTTQHCLFDDLAQTLNSNSESVKTPTTMPTQGDLSVTPEQHHTPPKKYRDWGLPWAMRKHKKSTVHAVSLEPFFFMRPACCQKESWTTLPLAQSVVSAPLRYYVFRRQRRSCGYYAYIYIPSLLLTQAIYSAYRLHKPPTIPYITRKSKIWYTLRSRFLIRFPLAIPFGLVNVHWFQLRYSRNAYQFSCSFIAQTCRLVSHFKLKKYCTRGLPQHTALTQSSARFLENGVPTLRDVHVQQFGLGAIRLTLPLVQTFSLQLGNACGLRFFETLRLPRCTRVLVEECVPFHYVMHQSTHLLTTKVESRQEGIRYSDKDPREFDSYLSFLEMLLFSPQHLQEMHLCIGYRVPHKNVIMMYRTDYLMNLYQRLLSVHGDSLQIISTYTPNLLSYAMLMNENVFTPYNSLQKLVLVDFEKAQLFLHDFGVTVLRRFPRLTWRGAHLVLDTSPSQMVPSLLPNREWRPSDPAFAAYLERKLLLSLESAIVKLTLGHISLPFVETFAVSSFEEDEEYPSLYTSSHSVSQLHAVHNMGFVDDALSEKLQCIGFWEKRGRCFLELPLLNERRFVRNGPRRTCFTENDIDFIPSTILFHKCTQLTLLPNQYLNRGRKGGQQDSMDVYYKRAYILLQHCIFGSRGRFQNPLMHSKSRLTINASPDWPAGVFAVLPKYHLVVNKSIELMSSIVSHRGACKQLRGFIGSVPSVLAHLTFISKHFYFGGPTLKTLELWIPHSSMRALASIRRIVESLKFFKKISELRVLPLQFPSYLTFNDIFSFQSSEAEFLHYIVHTRYFVRDLVAEMEIWGYHDSPMFVFVPSGSVLNRIKLWYLMKVLNFPSLPSNFEVC